MSGYIKWFANQNNLKNHNLFFLNVPAPSYDERYTHKNNLTVLSTVTLFNNLLKKKVNEYGYHFIDLFQFTNGNDGFSNGLMHIDPYHLGHQAIVEIEKQLRNLK